MACPDEEQLSAHALGGAVDPQVALHVDGCERCRSVLAALLHDSLSAPGASAALPPPEVERYTVLRLLGGGGMGRVYVAVDNRLQRKVALKVVRSERAHHSTEELAQEAQALARLSHPNVVQVHDLGRSGEGLFVAMEYVEGRTLGRWLEEAPRGWRQVLHVLQDAGDGLAAAHAAGLVHRDFKPSNVLVGSDGRARVSDFGLAQPDAGGPAVPRAGTPAYLAPECLRGERATAASDQYAFALTCREALFGQRPSTATPALPLPTGPWVPRDVRTALVRALAPDPAHRFPSMRALLDELRRPWWRPRAPRRVAVAAGALLLVGVGVAAAFGVRQRRCDVQTRAIDAVWSTERRDSLRSSFAAAAGDSGTPAFDAVAAALDAFAESWRDAQRQLCFHDDPVSLARAECLNQNLGSLGTLLGLLAHADRRLAVDAPRVVRGLAHPGSCLAVFPNGAGSADPARRAELGQKLSELQALRALGRYDEVIAKAPSVEALAKTLEAPGELTQALLLRGSSLAEKGDLNGALDPLFEAAAAAQTAHSDLSAVAAWLDLARVTRRAGRLDDAERWVQLASGTLQRTPDAWAELELLSQRASLLAERGRLEEALAEAHRAAEIANTVAGANDERTFRIRRTLAHVLFLAGKFDQVLAIERELLELRRTQLGEQHPELAKAHLNMSGTLGSLNRYDEALEHANKARAFFESESPPPPFLVDVLNNCAQLELARQNPPGAVAVQQRALVLAKTTLAPENPKWVRLFANLAYMELRGGQLEAATEHYREALDYAHRLGRDDHPDVIPVASGAAMVHLALGQLSAADAYATRAQSLAEKHAHVTAAPKRTDAATSLAFVRLAQNRRPEALAQFEAALGPGTQPIDLLQREAAELGLALVELELRLPRPDARERLGTALQKLKKHPIQPPELKQFIARASPWAPQL